MRNRSLVVVVPCALGALAIAAAAGAHGGSGVHVTLTHPLPNVIRQQAHVLVRGHAPGAPTHARAALEIQRTHPTGSPWGVAASAPIARNGAFKLRWHVPDSEQTGPVTMRVVVLSQGSLIAATSPRQSAIGPAFVPCAKPVPPMVDIPIGDGWIVGGAYGIGGAYPGVDECIRQQYTVTATNSSGKVAASEIVAGGHSYTLAPLPAGTYALRAGACTGTANVSAGKQTRANADCLYP